jgi:hypothetical protein
MAILGYKDLGHSEAGHNDALGMRLGFLVEVGRRAQQSIIDQAVKSGEFDLTDLSADKATALCADRSKAFEGLHAGDDGWT